MNIKNDYRIMGIEVFRRSDDHPNTTTNIFIWHWLIHS